MKKAFYIPAGVKDYLFSGVELSLHERALRDALASGNGGYAQERLCRNLGATGPGKEDSGVTDLGDGRLYAPWSGLKWPEKYFVG